MRGINDPFTPPVGNSPAKMGKNGDQMAVTLRRAGRRVPDRLRRTDRLVDSFANAGFRRR